VQARPALARCSVVLQRVELGERGIAILDVEVERLAAARVAGVDLQALRRVVEPDLNRREIVILVSLDF
jgi:hypothetical protein